MVRSWILHGVKFTCCFINLCNKVWTELETVYQTNKSLFWRSQRILIDMTVLNSTALAPERTDAQSPPVLYNYLITAHRVKHSSNMAPASTDYVVCIICWSQTKIRSVTRELSCKFSSLYEFRSCDVSSNQLWGYVNVVSCCCSLSVCFYCLRRQTQRL